MKNLAAFALACIVLTGTAQTTFEGEITFGIQAQTGNPMVDYGMATAEIGLKIGAKGMAMNANMVMVEVQTLYKANEPYLYFFTSMDDNIYRDKPDGDDDPATVKTVQLKGDTTICGYACKKYKITGTTPGEATYLWVTPALKWPGYFANMTGENDPLLGSGKVPGIPLVIRSKTEEGTITLVARKVTKRPIQSSELKLPEGRPIVDGRPG